MHGHLISLPGRESEKKLLSAWSSSKVTKTGETTPGQTSETRWEFPSITQRRQSLKPACFPVVSVTQQLHITMSSLFFHRTELKKGLPPSSWFQGSLWQDGKKAAFSLLNLRRNQTVPCPDCCVTIFIPNGSDLGVQPSSGPHQGQEEGEKKATDSSTEPVITSCSDRCAIPQSPQQEVTKAFQVFMVFAQRCRSPTYLYHAPAKARNSPFLKPILFKEVSHFNRALSGHISIKQTHRASGSSGWYLGNLSLGTNWRCLLTKRKCPKQYLLLLFFF